MHTPKVIRFHGALYRLAENDLQQVKKDLKRIGKAIGDLHQRISDSADTLFSMPKTTMKSVEQKNKNYLEAVEKGNLPKDIKKYIKHAKKFFKLA